MGQLVEEADVHWVRDVLAAGVSNPETVAVVILGIEYGLDQFRIGIRKRVGCRTAADIHQVTSKNTPSARPANQIQKNLFEFDHRERVRWGNWVSLI
jgi:hypothetical protein